VLEVQPEQLDRELAVNLKTAFLVSQAAIPLLLERGGGAIVNFASIAVLKPQRHMGSYSAAKAAVAGLTRALALARAERGVRVIGGGCYGTFYAGQLAKAKQRGRADYRCVVVVDQDPGCRARAELGEAPDRRFVCRDWSAYFATVLGDAVRPRPGEPEDYIVPS